MKTKQQEQFIEKLKDILPHGSGIDCDWHFDALKNGKVRASNSFHCMNDYGFYDGYSDFTIVIDPKDVGNFRLMFNGDWSQHLNRKYMLREYLEDTIYWALTDNN